MLSYFKKQTFQDIQKVDMKELKKRIKIVVIDDEQDSFPLESIQSFGFTIEYWSQIDSNNLKRLENSEFDIIILDINGVVKKSDLGNFDGLDILKILKEKNNNQVIVAFSGSSYDISKGDFWKLADNFLSKPITLLDTKTILEEIIDDNFSNNNLIKNLEKLMSTQITDNSNYKILEDLIVKSINKKSSLDLAKIVKLGITDTAGIMTIVSVLSDLNERFRDI